MSGPFYNTTRLRGPDLAAAIAQAKRQEDAVLVVYENAARPLSPSQVWHMCWQAGLECPLTSIRRAIHDLTDRALLRKTDELVPGHYRAREHLWTRAEA